MSQEKLRKALEDPIGQSRQCGAGNKLGMLFWHLVASYQITAASWQHSMMKFVRDERNVPVQTPDRRNEKRANMAAELTNLNRLTWNKFLEGLKAIEVVHARITIETQRGRRRLYAMSRIDIPMGDLDTTEEIIESVAPDETVLALEQENRQLTQKIAELEKQVAKLKRELKK